MKGYQLILVMPESMSIERRRIMAAYGAELELTPREKGMKGAIERAKELVAADARRAGCRSSSRTPPTSRSTSRTTAREILADFPEGIDYLITGVGTGGHITGVSEVLKEQLPEAARPSRWSRPSRR